MSLEDDRNRRRLCGFAPQVQPPLDRTIQRRDSDMKDNLNFHNSNFQIWPRRVGAMLLVAGTLLTGELAGSAAVLATPMQLAQSQAEVPIAPTPRSRNVRSVRQAVRRDLAQHLNIRRAQVRIVSIDRQTWPDGCLGLAQPGQLCTQALVEGWRVTAQANNQTWIYRTDATGTTLRREGNTTPSDNQLPQGIRDRVFQAISEEFNASGSLVVAAAERRTWNGCLGISEPDVMCTAIAIAGWRVTVVDANTLPEERIWVYHTNEDGTQVRFNPTESSIGGTIAPIQILPENLPQPLGRDVVFRSITFGGLMGERREVTLYEDGRVVSQRRGQTQTSRVSRQQVEQFRQLLGSQQFDRFDRLDFSGSALAADGLVVMLVSPNSVTQYADRVEEGLPPALRQVIEAWRDIVQTQRAQR